MVPIPNISRKTRNRVIFGLLLGTLTVLGWALIPRLATQLSGENTLLVRFYDVGQGDAILIQKGVTQILIDGGPNEEVLTYLGRDLLPWDRKIELLVLTHPHADHLTGLLAVLERYQVERVLYYPSVYDTRGYEKFLEKVKNEGAQVLQAVRGGRLRVGEISLQILWPTANYRDENVNNESVALLMGYGDFETLLLGDAELGVQFKMAFINTDVEVIKMAHHGSKNGAYESLLRTASPELAVISVGAKNSYGHPHSSTLNLLRRLGIPFLRTDLSGTVTVRSDGRNFWYSTRR
ncbi:MAG: ComEC/Rec2 family competence protein [Patescibacteria group bacterium]|nr:MAG: ComEC/Rec2 family competence protein [Patescibacteria group bacterium]